MRIVARLTSRQFAFQWAFVVLALQPLSIAQAAPSAATQKSSVPFVGCPSDGQVGPRKAPQGKNRMVAVSPKVAQRLAYYKAEEGFGVLAPRGWHCFSAYGSNGDSLFVSPEPIDSKIFSSDGWNGFTGPAIQISVAIGDTSGRFEVAAMIARVFPAHLDHLQEIIAEGIAPASAFPTGPYPNDKLTYRSKEIVEFETPANTDGLGTASRLRKSALPIKGVTILVGEEMSMVHLSVRLSPEMSDLTQAIIQRTGLEASEDND